MAGVEKHPGPRTLQQILLDKKNEKEEKKFVEMLTTNGRNRIVFQEADGEIFLMGETSTVKKVLLCPQMTIEELMDLLRNKVEVSSFTSTLCEIIPKLTHKIRSKMFTAAQASRYLQQILTVRGIGGRYGGKKYGEGEQPEGWPSPKAQDQDPRLVWAKFEGPAKSTFEVNTKIIRSFLEHFGYEPDTHFEDPDEPDEPQQAEEFRTSSSRASVISAIGKPLPCLSPMSTPPTSPPSRPPSQPPSKGQRLPKLYRQISARHRKFFKQGQVLRQILGNGACLYGCIAFHIFQNENSFRNIRKACHRFLKETWNMLGGMAEQEESLFPVQNFTIFNEKQFVSFDTVEEWLNFLQTDKSLQLYSEMETETQNIANFFGLDINIFHYNNTTRYETNYIPMPDIHNLSPWRRDNLEYGNTIYIYHKLDDHFDVIVNKP